MMKLIVIILNVLFLQWLGISCCLAYYGGGGAISGGSGQAGVAVKEESESGFLNPASVAQTLGYHIRFSGAYVPNSHHSGYLIHIVDHTPEIMLPASLIYSEFNFSHYWPHRDVRVNLAKQINSKTSIGLGLGYQTKKFDTHLLNENRSEFYGILGINYFFTQNGSLGAVFHSLSQEFTLGISYIFHNMIRLRSDLAPYRIHFGFESYLNKWFILRLGYLDIKNKNYQTWGLGFSGPKLSMQYAWTPLLIQGFLDYIHMIDLSIWLW